MINALIVLLLSAPILSIVAVVAVSRSRKRIVRLEAQIQHQEALIKQVKETDMPKAMAHLAERVEFLEYKTGFGASHPTPPIVPSQKPVSEPLHEAVRTVATPSKPEPPVRVPERGVAPELARPRTAAVSSIPAPAEKPRRSLADLETLLGTQWLNKIGIAILVIGISWFLGYSLQYIGAMGKVCLGYTVSAALLAFGLIWERRKIFAVYGKVLVGGGWATAYFTTYAAHHLPAAQVIYNAHVGLLLLLLVAAVIIGHSLAYKSQVLTTIAYGLAFLTLALNPLSTFSLWAVAILAASFGLILRRLAWGNLAILGMLAAYFVGLMWAWHFTQGVTSGVDRVGIFSLGIFFFCLYWCIFTWQNLFLTGSMTPRLRQFHAFANASLFFLSVGYLGHLPELRFYFLSAFGLIYLALAYLWFHRKERTDFRIHATVAVVLLVGAVPCKLVDDSVFIAWLLEAELLLLLGFYLKDVYLKTLGVLLFAASWLLTLMFPYAGGTILPISDYALSLTTSRWIAAFLCYANAYLGMRLMPRDVIAENDQRVLRAFSYAGCIALLALIFNETQHLHLGSFLAILAVMLFFMGCRFRQPDLRNQSYVTFGIAFLWVLLLDLLRTGHQILWICPDRLFIGGNVALLFYLSARKMFQARKENVLQPTDTWVGGSVALAAIAGAIVYVCRNFLVELSEIPRVLFGWLDSTFATWIMLFFVAAAILLALALKWVLKKRPAVQNVFALFPEIGLLYPATILTTFLLWYQLDPLAIAVGWALFGVLSLELGLSSNYAPLIQQGHVLCTLSFVRLVFANLTTEEAIHGFPISVLTVSLLAILYYALYFRLQGENGQPTPQGKFYSYLAGISLVCILRFQADPSWVAALWAWLAVMFLAAREVRGDSVFGVQAGLLTLAAIIRVVFNNLYLTGQYEYFSQATATALPVLAGVSISCAWNMFRAKRYPMKEPPSVFKEAPQEPFLDRITTQVRRAVSAEWPLYFYGAATLLTLLILHDTSRAFLTVSLGVEGLFLFALGLIVSQRTIRWTGLFLLIACILKVFLIDLSSLETGYRIMSFIVLGLILLTVSYLYTKYRQAIWKIL